MCGSALRAADSPSALETFNALGGGRYDLSVPVPTFRPAPVFENMDGGFTRQSNPLMEACRGERSCFMALDGAERQFCEAYKERKSCFMALDGADRDWCERGNFPGKHLFWKRCAE